MVVQMISQDLFLYLDLTFCLRILFRFPKLKNIYYLHIINKICLLCFKGQHLFCQCHKDHT